LKESFKIKLAVVHSTAVFTLEEGLLILRVAYRNVEIIDFK